MAFTVMPILGLNGTAGAAIEPTGDGNVCEGAPDENAFSDVPDDDIAAGEIECMLNVEPEVTRGTTATTYSPSEPVTRRQMALFLYRVAQVSEAEETAEDAVTELPEGDGHVPFSDIEPDDIAFAEIDALDDAGIARGLEDGTFRPNAPVTRRQMAKFLVRLQEFLAGEAVTPDNPDDAFTDDNGDSGEDDLNVVAAAGIFEGDGDGNVDPGADISRRQMALVLTRTLEWFFENDVIGPLFAPGQVQNVVATTIDEDTIRVTWDAVAGTDSYNLYRATASGADDDCPEAPTSYTNVASDTAAPYDDDELTAATTYCYVVTAVNDGDEGPRSASASSTTSSTTTPPVIVGPESTDARLATEAGSAGEADTDDVWWIVFTEPVTVAANDVIRVQDEDGEFQDVECAVDATCATNASTFEIDGQDYAADRVLTVTLNATGGDVDGDADGNAANDDGALQYPLTITTQSGITDATNNAWTPSDDPDNVIEYAGPQATVDAGSAGDTAFTVTFSEPIDEATLSCGDFVLRDADEAVDPGADATVITCGAISFNAASTIATVAITGEPLAAGDQLRLTATSVEDLDGNAGPPAAVLDNTSP